MYGSPPLLAPRDTRQVDVSHAGDMKYWTRHLGVSEQNLRSAVALVGSVTDDVRAELRRKRAANESPRALRIFVFYPSINHRDWWVLLPGAEQQTFATEGAAVGFALNRAKALRGSGRAIDVMQEKITGTWMRVQE